MADLGKAYVQIVPSAKGMGGGIKRELEGTGAESGGGFGSAFAAAAKKIIAAAAIGATIKKSLDLGGELQQNLGGTEAVFGEWAKNVQDKATEAYKNMGMSASDYMATANKMGSLFQGSGLEQQRSLELTTAAMQRAADVASVMGIDTSAAMESIAGAAKGNFTMMDNLGVAMNATTLEAYALEKGVNFKWNTASNAEKAELAMQMFMERTAQYENNFAHESESTFSGSIGAMKAAAENFMANLSLGRDVQKPLAELVETAKTFLMGNLLPMIGNIIKAIPTLLTSTQDIGKQLIEEIKTGITQNAQSIVSSGAELLKNLVVGIIQNAAMLISAAVQIGAALWQELKKVDWIGIGRDIMDALKSAITQASSSIFGDGKTLDSVIADMNAKLPEILDKGIEIIDNVVSGIMTAAPKLLEQGGTIILSVAKGIVAALPTILQKGGELINRLITGISNGLPELGTKAGEIIGKFGRYLVEHFPEILAKGAELMGQLIAGIVKAIPKVLEALFNLGKSMAEQFDGVNWLEIGNNILYGIYQGLISMTSIVIDAITQVCKDIWKGFTDFFGIASPSKKMKTGAIDIIKGIIEGLGASEWVNKAVAAMTGLAGKILGGFDPTKAKAKGEAILSNIKSGLENSGIINQCTAAAQALMTAVGNALTIADDNPFLNAGLGIGAQIAKGIGQNQGNAAAAVQSVVDAAAAEARRQANQQASIDYARSRNLMGSLSTESIYGSEGGGIDEVAYLLAEYLPIIASQRGVSVNDLYNSFNRQMGYGLT